MIEEHSMGRNDIIIIKIEKIPKIEQVIEYTYLFVSNLLLTQTPYAQFVPYYLETWTALFFLNSTAISNH
jgi:hypothetical protein